MQRIKACMRWKMKREWRGEGYGPVTYACRRGSGGGRSVQLIELRNRRPLAYYVCDSGGTSHWCLGRRTVKVVSPPSRVTLPSVTGQQGRRPLRVLLPSLSAADLSI